MENIESPENRIKIKNERLQVPNEPVIPLIKGDGIGPDVVKAAITVLDSSVKQAYNGGRKIFWKEYLAGDSSKKAHGKWLPEETINAIEYYKIALKGPLTTPVGEGYRSLNVTLRQRLDLYACVRPVEYIPGVPSRLMNPEELNVVIFRENTEDVYAGIEYDACTSKANKVIAFLRDEMGEKIRIDSSIGIKPISEFATKRITRAAINYAIKHNRKSVTIVHKGNIMKYTEGGFRKWGYEVAENEFRDCIVTESEIKERTNSIDGNLENKLVIKDRIADNMMQQIILRTREYDVLVLPNLTGDYISDLAAALVGGLGIAPGANINYETGKALFEPTHGTAPKYANQDIANPTSAILSGVMLLDYIGWNEASSLVKKGVTECIKENFVTNDFARQMPGVNPVKTSEFAKKIVSKIET
ncbi:MAG: isocitrate dehydrogenase (NADP(+)) [Candidatus Bathyarchaeota archaeon]|nr:isocitrate dehydrogenase (NADP(+)) [Candidatus Bathyarchaeota archaeon]MCZ2845379.1 isocitrate dehydrogenase (NADP(+)) [Candidatus Bathyarchaeota archaeon]